MFDLAKEEKIVLLFLLGLLAVGTGVNYYKNSGSVITNEAVRASAPAKEEPLFVNVNTAKLGDLIRIKGIGVKLASRIIEFRDENGPFFRREDIMKVKGIGKKKFEAIKNHIITE